MKIEPLNKENHYTGEFNIRGEYFKVEFEVMPQCDGLILEHVYTEDSQGDRTDWLRWMDEMNCSRIVEEIVLNAFLVEKEKNVEQREAAAYSAITFNDFYERKCA